MLIDLDVRQITCPPSPSEQPRARSIQKAFLEVAPPWPSGAPVLSHGVEHLQCLLPLPSWRTLMTDHAATVARTLFGCFWLSAVRWGSADSYLDVRRGLSASRAA